MPEGLEGVALLLQTVEKEEECELREPGSGWRCNLDGNSDTLGDNLEAAGIAKPEEPSPRSVEACDKETWPAQAHHLIPWQHLKRHQVKKLLKRGSKVFADNDYDVDHANNGIWLPYARPLREWKRARSGKKKREVANALMNRARRQMHQGPHSKKRYISNRAAYKEQVDRYLGIIFDECFDHADGCSTCGPKRKGKKAPPRRNVVRFVDTASGCLANDILACRVFVSRRAAAWRLDSGGT